MTIFNDYSQRAKRVMVISRLKAALRSSSYVDVIDLVSAILVEDQGDKLATPLLGIPLDDNYYTSIESVASRRLHQPLLSLEGAAEALTKLEEGIIAAKPTATVGDAPLSRALEEILNAARTVAMESSKERVTPLILLAAVLNQPHGREAVILRDVGITPERLQQLIEKEHSQTVA